MVRKHPVNCQCTASAKHHDYVLCLDAGDNVLCDTCQVCFDLGGECAPPTKPEIVADDPPSVVIQDKATILDAIEKTGDV